MNDPHATSAGPAQWFKSSYSNGSGGECMECARAGEATLVRDSKRPRGPVLAVTTDAWQVFVAAVALRGRHHAR
ncbi:DUF397 domain-containing protein [Streptomyces sp. ISL-36]|uniref:DUF397 domain-containing protein n=1 Tax=Streptomyces sp. ISL-36 TaxID=2819182 RepID=UPI001BE4F3E7|nr:DUF397 domain-containing protein [Streptomyces sp. ISL-36]MBT2443186.1 DUF397 domain-containing protein [Streptomyces sp. ISL-36]